MIMKKLVGHVKSDSHVCTCWFFCRPYYQSGNAFHVSFGKLRFHLEDYSISRYDIEILKVLINHAEFVTALTASSVLLERYLFFCIL